MTAEEVARWAEHRRALQRRKPTARPRFAYLLRPGDVIHAPIHPLEVVEPIAPDDDASIELLLIPVRWWWPTGGVFIAPLRHPPMRELLVSRLQP